MGQQNYDLLELFGTAGADMLVELAVYHLGDDVGNNAPYFEALTEAAGTNEFVGEVVGYQPEDAVALFEALDGELTIDSGHDDVAGLGLKGAVDGHQGAVDDVRRGTVHAVTTDPGQAGAIGVGQQNLIEVDFGPNVVLGRAGKAGENGSFALKKPDGLADNLKDFDGIHKMMRVVGEVLPRRK